MSPAWTINRSNDFPLGWTHQGAGTLAVTMRAPASSDYQMICQFDVAADNGTIPHQLLSMMAAGSEVLVVVADSELRCTVDAWSIGISSSRFDVGSDGATATAHSLLVLQ